MLGHAAHVIVDGHLVVVEHDDEGRLLRPRAVERLKGNAAVQGAVADDSHAGVVLAFQIPGLGVAEGGGYGRSAVTRIKSVAAALHPLGETGEPVQLPQRRHVVPAAGQQLVDVGLMAHVPYDAVFVHVEDAVQRQSQLHDAQIRCQVTPAGGDVVQEFLPDLHGQKLEASRAHVFYVVRQIMFWDDIFHYCMISDSRKSMIALKTSASS